MEIFTELKKIAKKETGKDISKDDTFRDLGIDSIDLLDFVMKVENHFNIKIEDSELLKINSISDVISILEKKVKK
ncbi:/ acpA / Acyl carrier protein /:72637 Forward [Candidatus Hepatoplasma crinochetorum]|uniref:/ acpA / Acyl carrier protein /:72637 Forward n=1 Tax=Candidatus Hepatoplasma crinochetorum TaxID=295596 RepID=A0A0G7ZM04_9MOLU|nr:/ acpA / Acyl carrier protein /:72637 Forward [Candidatus Hepatoplasma crinochetorum]